MKHYEFFLTNVFELVAGYQIPMLSQRILGSPGGKHCKSLEESCFFVKSSDFVQRIAHFRHDLVRSGRD